MLVLVVQTSFNSIQPQFYVKVRAKFEVQNSKFFMKGSIERSCIFTVALNYFILFYYTLIIATLFASIFVIW